MNAIDTQFIRLHARNILDTTTVGYLKTAQLRGSLFEQKPAQGVVSSVYTEFFVNHDEPLEALAHFQQSRGWSLGNLLDGHEFLIILPVPAVSPTISERRLV